MPSAKKLMYKMCISTQELPSLDGYYIAGAYPGGGGAEGARAPPFVSEGVLVKGANPRSFLERNLQFHTRIYCIHVLVDRQSRHAVARL